MHPCSPWSQQQQQQQLDWLAHSLEQALRHHPQASRIRAQQRSWQALTQPYPDLAAPASASRSLQVDQQHLQTPTSTAAACEPPLEQQLLQLALGPPPRPKRAKGQQPQPQQPPVAGTLPQPPQGQEAPPLPPSDEHHPTPTGQAPGEQDRPAQPRGAAAAGAATEQREGEPPPPLSVGPDQGLRLHAFAWALPRRPLLTAVCQSLSAWVLTGRFPFPMVERCRPDLLQEGPEYHASKQQLAGQVEQLRRGAWLQRTLAAWATNPAAQHAGGVSAPGADGDGRRGGQRGPAGADSEEAPCPQPHLEQPPLPRDDGAWAQRHRERDLGSDGMGDGGKEEGDVGWRALEGVFGDGRALLVLLGFRVTTGTARDVAPLPGLDECVAAFGERHAPPPNLSILTVGARALAKHHHRDGSAKFWGDCTGPEAAKNAHAAGLLLRLLRGAVWLNVHHMPPSSHVLELRLQEGYGCRWQLDGAGDAEPPDTARTPALAEGAPPSPLEGGAAGLVSVASPPAAPLASPKAQQSAAGGPQEAKSPFIAFAAPGKRTGGACVRFRGFLEPQDPSGHEKGWRH